MIYTLKNDNLIVEINTKGAEISSIIHNSIEHLWQADPAFWGKKAPLLFPIVGGLLDSKTNINDKPYEIEKHGFIKYLDFDAIFISNDKLILKCSHTEDTLKNYPFKFNVIVEYSLENNKFHQKYEVINADENEMVYGFGLHPGFNLEHSGLSFEDYYIDFNEDIEINAPILTDKNLMDFNNTQKILTTNGKLKLECSLFLVDAIILNNLSSNKVSLFTNDNKKVFDFEFSGFDIFALWQAKDSPFICFEPWSSLAGIEPCPKNLENNETMKFLAPNTSKMYNVTITF